MVYKVKISQVQHCFGNVADLLSSLCHGIPVYSIAYFQQSPKIHGFPLTNFVRVPNSMDFHCSNYSIFCIPWNSMAFHNIPPGCHIIPLKCHGNSIETIETMAIFCIPWNSMAFHSIPHGYQL